MADFVDSMNAFNSLVFTSSKSGVFYALVDYLELTPQPSGDTIKIPFPCQISVNGRRKVVVTEVDGLLDTVKEDMGFSGYDLNISFEIGDYGVLPWQSLKAVSVPKASELVRNLANLVRNHKGEVKITQGANIQYEHRPEQFLPTLDEVAAGLESALPEVEAKEPLLTSLEIKKVVLQTFAVNPTKNHRYQVTLTAVAELDTDEDKLFQEVGS